MSLVGFKARNHPQQAVRPDVDDRMLPVAEFAKLNERFRFTIDVAASAENARDRLRIEFLAGRTRFIHRGKTEVGPNERPPFGCCLAIWRNPSPYSRV